MRALRILLAIMVLAVLGYFLPASIGGKTSYVVTHGISMEPGFHGGDLAIVRQTEEYSVGDVVAYNSEQMQTVVMHRIISVEGDRYSFQGDNNNFVDVDHPTRNEFLGKLVVLIPEGGIWLKRITSPPSLGIIAFALVAGGGATAVSRKRRRNRRTNVSRHISDRPATPQSGISLSVGNLSPSLRVAAAGTAVLGLLGASLGVLAWAGPLEESSSAQVKSGTGMKFSYTADVGQSAAYDGTIATSPDPIFRKLANSVDVRFVYTGDPGTVTVAAELTSPSGWRSTVPLAGPQPITGNSYEGTATLDLKALQTKADAAAAVTGQPGTPVSISLIPQVTTESGAEFNPELKLSLTPLQLSLTGGEPALTVADTAPSQRTVMAPRTIGVNGWTITAETARVLSAILLGAALIAALVITLMARRSTPADEATTILRRYANLLVAVHPMTASQGRPVIDVTTFATLAKLAERLGLLVLHWNRSGVETFIVQDENITYRYRSGASASAADPQPAPPDLPMSAESASLADKDA